MNVLCVAPKRWELFQWKRTVRRIVPEAVVHGCRHPAEAFKTAKTQGCDVLLTEIEMDGRRGDGLDLARALRAINPKLNVIFITNCPERKYAHDVIQMRASGYIRKPCGQERLAEEFANLRYGPA